MEEVVKSPLPALSVYRRLGARIFDRAARETGLTPTQLRAALTEALHRPTLTPPTLRAWRRGNKPVPLGALLAVCDLAGRKPFEILAIMKGDELFDDRDVRELLSRL